MDSSSSMNLPLVKNRLYPLHAYIPEGSYAVGVHVGPYERLYETYLDIIGRWFPQSGYDLAIDAVIEHYLNDPSCTPKQDLRTEVRVKIAD